MISLENRVQESVCEDVLQQVLNNTLTAIQDHRQKQKAIIPYVSWMVNSQQQQIFRQESPPCQPVSSLVDDDKMPTTTIKDNRRSDPLEIIYMNKESLKPLCQAIINAHQSGKSSSELVQSENTEKKKVKISEEMAEKQYKKKCIKLEASRTLTLKQMQHLILEEELRACKNREEKQNNQSNKSNVKYLDMQGKHKRGNSNLSDKKYNNYTHDIDGTILPYSSIKHQRSLSKPYPEPLKINFIDNNPKESDKQSSYKQIKSRSASFSMNKNAKTSKAANKSEKNTNPLKKSNNLFSNNHQRQISSIPFFQMKPGTKFLQHNTNLKIVKQPESQKCFSTKITSHQTFKKYTKTSAMQQTLKEKMSKVQSFQEDEKKQNNTKRQTKTAGETRKSTSQHMPNRPKTTIRTANSNHHIRVNSNLLISLLQ